MKRGRLLIDYSKFITALINRPACFKNRPMHLQLETTNSCNLKCHMCWRSDLIKEPKFLSFSQFNKVIEEVKPRKVNLSGLGEPLLNKDIFKMIRFAKTGGLSVTIATNFTLAQDKIEELFESGIDLIKISIDAAQRDTYKKIRRADYFDSILNSISLLNNFKRKFKTAKPHLRFNFAIQNENIDELIDLIYLAKKYAVESIYIQYIKFYGHEKERDSIVGVVEPQVFLKTLIEAEKTARKEGILTNIPIWLRNFKLFYNRFEKIKLPNMRKCYSPWFEVFIEANGDVRPCPIFAWKRQEGVMGNIFNSGFEEIWNSSDYKLFRSGLKKGARPFGICEECLPFTLREFFGIFSKTMPGFNKLKNI